MMPSFKPNPADTTVLGKPVTTQLGQPTTAGLGQTGAALGGAALGGAASVQPVPGVQPPVTIDNFLPVFQTGVEEISFGTAQWQAYSDPFASLSEDSAQQLLVLFADLNPKIVHLPPSGPVFAGKFRGFSNPAGVPWFVFPDGSFVNAGADIAQWWSHYIPILANWMARGIIAENMRGVADHPEWKYDPAIDTGATGKTE